MTACLSTRRPPLVAVDLEHHRSQHGLVAVTADSVVSRSGPIAAARETLASLCVEHARVAVTSRPGLGKSLLTKGLGFADADEHIGQSWELQRHRLATANLAPTWRLRGVVVARALSTGLLAPSAVLWLRGLPLHPAMTLSAAKIGDNVETWVQTFLGSPFAKGCHVVEWHVREPKYC